MRVDIGNALTTVADPGVPRRDLDALDDRVGTAHDRITDGIADRSFGYAALALPDTADPATIRATVADFEPVETVLVVGIGGSALGATTLCHALGDGTDVHVLDNIDPAHVGSVVAAVDLEHTVVHVVSRSGTTAETLANFLVVRDAFDEAGIDWTEHTLITTREDGPLWRLATDHDIPTFDAPPGVPGRFAVLSTVALPAAAMAGVPIEDVLAGAAQGRDSLAGSLFDSPAYAYGALCYALDRRGAHINAVMPYAEALEPFAEWVAQLWAESLGKDGTGQTPVRALGVTDQHSQLQLYRAGPRDKLLTFIRPRDRPDVPIPETDLPELEYLSGRSLGDLMDAEFRATEASLAAAGRPSIRVEVEALDPTSLGELLYGFEAATVLAGELYDVETFTQPAVEWGKQATRDLLTGRDDPTTVGDSLPIE
ncbi:MAG: glucose-6-phosphate isomerase [Halobacteriaceae archaeon]